MLVLSFFLFHFVENATVLKYEILHATGFNMRRTCPCGRTAFWLGKPTPLNMVIF
jgi:hypothetical protein